MVPAWSFRHGISCSWHLSRSQAEIPLIPAVQFSQPAQAAYMCLLDKQETRLGSGLVNHSQKMTEAAMQSRAGQ